jgi:putative ABC transport system permease protein
VRVFPQEQQVVAREERSGYIALYGELMRSAREIDGVSDVAAANATPLSTELPALPVELEGHPFIPGQTKATMLWAGAVTPGYFNLLHIPLRAGRLFTEGDAEKSAQVVLVSSGTATQYWPGETAVGKRIRILWEESWRTVIGVVGDVRQYDLAGTSPDWINGALYMPYAQSVGLDRRLPTAMTLMLRTTAKPPQLEDKLRRLAASVNPELPVSDVRLLEAAVTDATSPSRTLMWLFVSFGGAALLLAAIGAYGVVSYAVEQRTYEVGVRMALGATPRRIFGLVLGQSVRLVLAGLALGMVASLALTRVMTGFLYGVNPTDPLTFAGVGFLLIAVALLAGYVPAKRASKVDPLVALRSE